MSAELQKPPVDELAGFWELVDGDGQSMMFARRELVLETFQKRVGEVSGARKQGQKFTWTIEDDVRCVMIDDKPIFIARAMPPRDS